MNPNSFRNAAPRLLNSPNSESGSTVQMYASQRAHSWRVWLGAGRTSGRIANVLRPPDAY